MEEGPNPRNPVASGLLLLLSLLFLPSPYEGQTPKLMKFSMVEMCSVLIFRSFLRPSISPTTHRKNTSYASKWSPPSGLSVECRTAQICWKLGELYFESRVRRLWSRQPGIGKIRAIHQNDRQHQGYPWNVKRRRYVENWASYASSPRSGTLKRPKAG